MAVKHGLCQILEVVWNNCFQRIFQCCWRESTRPVQFYCKSLPLTLLIDQRKLLLRLQIRHSDNAVLQTMSMLNRSEFTALYSKYSCNVVMLPGKVKNMIWDKFARSVSL